MNPKNGSILALASSPSYDPSVYIGRVTTQKELAAQGLTPAVGARQELSGAQSRPRRQYPPGSTFKPLTAIAASQEEMIKPYAL